jgi:hypothetical protein
VVVHDSPIISWQWRLVEIAQFNITVSTAIDWTKTWKRGTSPRPSPSNDDPKIRIYAGFDPVRAEKGGTNACLLVNTYCRGRLVARDVAPYSRLKMNIRQFKSKYHQGLTVIVDDFDGALPLNSAKDHVRFRGSHATFKRNLEASLGAICQFYWEFCIEKYCTRPYKTPGFAEIDALTEAVCQTKKELTLKRLAHAVKIRKLRLATDRPRSFIEFPDIENKMRFLGQALRVPTVDRHKQKVVMGDRFNVRLNGAHRMTAKRQGPTNDAAEQCDGPTHRPAASRKLRSTRSGDEDLKSDDGNNRKMAPSAPPEESIDDWDSSDNEVPRPWIRNRKEPTQEKTKRAKHAPPKHKKSTQSTTEHQENASADDDGGILDRAWDSSDDDFPRPWRNAEASTPKKKGRVEQHNLSQRTEEAVQATGQHCPNFEKMVSDLRAELDAAKARIATLERDKEDMRQVIASSLEVLSRK